MNLIKRIMLIGALPIVSSLFVFGACNDEEPKPAPQVKPSVRLFEAGKEGLELKQLEFESAGGVRNLGASHNVTITIASTDEAWCHVDLTESSKTRSEFTLTVDANTANQPREAKVEVSFKGSVVASVAVSQKAAPEVVKPSEPSDEPDVAFADYIGLGWNLGNQFDAHNNEVASETAWGNPKVQSVLFEKLAAAGVKTVRVPVTWLGHVGAAPNYTIDAAWLDRVYEVVGFANNAGLNVIVNIHHDGADAAHWLDIKSTDVTNSIKNQISAMWTQIATRFADKGSEVMFETFNEIHDGGWGWGSNRSDGGQQYKRLNEWNQLAVDAIRATGGNNATRWIGVPGYCTNPDLTMEHFVLPTDAAGKLAVAVHYYDPFDYTLEDKFSEWGHTGKDVASYGDEAAMCNVFGKLKSKFIDNGMPVYFGEVGCVHRASAAAEAFRIYYLEYLYKACRTYGIPAIFWDNGSKNTGREASGLFNRTTGGFLNNGEEVVAAMARGYNTTDESYTLETVYATAPASAK